MAYILHNIPGRILHNLRTMAMPVGMLTGALFCRPISALEGASHQLITPTLIFLMLFVTFCRVRVREMRLKGMHGLLLLFQLVVSLALFLLLQPLNTTLAQGGMICVLAPVAMAAVVIGSMLGADITTMATYSLLCNLSIALLAPLYLSLLGSGNCTLWEILTRILPLLVGPFVLAQLFRLVLPKWAAWVAAHGQLSFYLWLISLVIVIGRTTSYIIDLGSDHLLLEIALAALALAICLVQFKLGRMVGRRYGDPAAGGQSLGQKNTVLAVWMAQSFLDPISSIAPTAYIVWQNLVNSYQIYRKERETH
ncbi:MAG: transporter [Rikenellaceae bacterium]|nr:transporter [Rikenellaceae bacterium]